MSSPKPKTRNPEPSKLRVAILISGRGSNMHALLRGCAGEIPDIEIDQAKIALVLSNIADAPGLEIAKQYKVKTEILPHKGYKDRREYDAKITEILRANKIDLVCLAGFMRLLSAEFCETWKNKLINIHPSLLPNHKGLDTHKRALAAGDAHHGCTVHFVTAEMDEGPIILQQSVPVLPDDDEQTLAARVLAAEHRCYPMALKLLSEGRIQMTGNKVVVNS
ncbi:MAG: phosphoribosylglycinamide formyltransferase [Alphaproteobacteria bacterium]|nr:MAG: phosphoribosylglycinamide formyltransferase [Alphaproteobacteria bacterium]